MQNVCENSIGGSFCTPALTKALKDNEYWIIVGLSRDRTELWKTGNTFIAGIKMVEGCFLNYISALNVAAARIISI